MFSIHDSLTAKPKLIPNVLPCRVQHTGPIRTSRRHWKLEQDQKNEQQSIAYFRGRKLLGRTAKLPLGYKGIVLRPTEKEIPVPKDEGQSRNIDQIEDDPFDLDRQLEDEAEEELTKILETAGTFEEVVVWGHEMLPEKDDQFIRGVEEWIGFAEALHTYERPSDTKS